MQAQTQIAGNAGDELIFDFYQCPISDMRYAGGEDGSRTRLDGFAGRIRSSKINDLAENRTFRRLKSLNQSSDLVQTRTKSTVENCTRNSRALLDLFGAATTISKLAGLHESRRYSAAILFVQILSRRSPISWISGTRLRH